MSFASYCFIIHRLITKQCYDWFCVALLHCDLFHRIKYLRPYWLVEEGEEGKRRGNGEGGREEEKEGILFFPVFFCHS